MLMTGINSGALNEHLPHKRHALNRNAEEISLRWSDIMVNNPLHLHLVSAGHLSQTGEIEEHFVELLQRQPARESS